MSIVCASVGNRDIDPFIPSLISSVARPAEVPDCVHKLSATTFVQVRQSVSDLDPTSFQLNMPSARAFAANSGNTLLTLPLVLLHLLLLAVPLYRWQYRCVSSDLISIGCRSMLS